jgi:hypothetical protein
MKRIIVSLWGMMSVLVSLAQTPQLIQGKIVDEQQQPLFGANLVWEGTTVGTISDEEGRFQLEAPSSYPQELQASYVGFETKVISVENNKPLHIVLSESVQLKDVEVKGKVNTTSLSMVNPRQVENISSGELEKAACCNLAESFETNASVDVSYTDAMTGARQIQMLGLDGVYSQITQEQIPLIRGLSSAYGLGYTPGSWIESIQVAKGVGSVVNGFESISGQINLELYKPKTALPLFVNGYVSSDGKLEKNIIFSEKKGDWISATLLHASSTTAAHDDNEDGFNDHPTGYQLSAVNRWQYVGNDDIGLQLVFKGLVEEKTAGSYDSDAYVVNLENKVLEFFGKTGWKRLDLPGKSMGFQTNLKMHEFNSAFDTKAYAATQYSAYANYIYQSYIGHEKNAYKAGLSYYADRYEKAGVLDTNHTDLISGLYWEFTRTRCSSSLVLGLRADYHSVHGLYYTPRVHYKWNPTEDMVVRLTGGRGFRTAQPLVENISALAANRTLRFEADLKPEVANNMGVNVSRCFYLFDREGTVSLDAYYTLFENQMIVNQETQGTLSFENLNGHSDSKVLQFDFSYALTDRLDVKGSYKRQEVYATFGGEEKFVPFVPKERMMFNVAYENYFEDWTFDITLQHIGSNRVPTHALLADNSQLSLVEGEYWSKPFQRVNTQVTHKLAKFDLYVGAENILGYIQENPILDQENPSSADFDASMIWAPTMGRMFYAGFRYKFKK